MGLLDEAIREHLELKRRHGADPGEVARLEHEALGPARREAIESAQSVEEAEHATAVATESASSPERAEFEPEPEAEPHPSAAPAADVDQPTQHFDAQELSEPASDETRDESAPAQPDEREGEAEEIVAADEEPDAADDVLEETPDFLQETPEHDRLWFEQKPPRDFDF